MEAIYIPQLLKAPQKTEEIQVQEFIDGLESLTPVRGKMAVVHRGNYLEVSVQAETIITLTCDRSLQQYNHRLSVETTELIWLEKNVDAPDNSSLEREVSLEELCETLPREGYFEPDVWLYEQLCLAMPLRQLRDKREEVDYSYREETAIDSRLSALETLKEQLSQSGMTKDE